MKKIHLALVISMAVCSSAALAQSGAAGITESNDPAKAAAVEQRAQELSQTQPGGASTKSSSKKSAHKTDPKRGAMESGAGSMAKPPGGNGSTNSAPASGSRSDTVSPDAGSGAPPASPPASPPVLPDTGALPAPKPGGY